MPEQTAAVPALSFAQHRLWFIDQLDPGNPGYNLSYAWRLIGPLDATALASAYRVVVARHETLRTAFPSHAGEPWPAVATEPVTKLSIVDISPLEESLRASELDRIARAEADRRFDLSTGPLVHAVLVSSGRELHHLLLTVHHIVADAWSVQVILRDLLARYRADTAPDGGGDGPPSIPLTFQEIADAERERASSDAGVRDLEYWRGRLSGLSGTLDLPTDRPRPPVPSLRGGSVRFALEPGCAAAIRRICRVRSATPFSVLLAAFSVLLYRYSGQPDIAVGVPVSSRRHTDLDVVGLLVNTVVIRTDLSEDPSFAALVRRTADLVMAGYEHQNLPFEAVVRELVTTRDLARNPLYQVMLSFNHAAGTAPQPMTGLRVEPASLAPTFARLDLTLMVDVVDGEYHCALNYAKDLFDEARVVRLVEHFTTLLAGAVDDPAQRVSQLPVRSAREHREVERWNATGIRYPELPVPALVARQAVANPDRPALGDGTGWLTYREFGARVRGLRRWLRDAGTRPETVIGVYLHRGHSLAIAMHAVLAAGGTYLPLEPGHPPDRVGWLAHDCGVRLVLTSTDLIDRLPPMPGVPKRCVEELSAPDDSTALTIPDPPLDALAYVMYTSGSTGVPKGVAIPHRAMMNRLYWMQQVFPLTADDVVLQKTPLGFDVSVWELCWPLTAGARLFLADPGGHRDSRYLAETIRANQITTVHFVPAMLDAFLDEPDLDTLTTLRRIICSGEALPTALANRCRTRLPHVQLHNLYGPTETTIDVSWHPCAPAETTTPIGRPVANTRLSVRDRELVETPIGVPGELCVSGVQVARGYLGRPGMAAERFVPDPAGPPGSRMYRTGDLAVWRDDGEVEFVGRLDSQVKLHGHRIEPGEIEASLLALPAVRSAAVVLRDDGPGPRLVAYLVTDPQAPAEDWSARLAERLPAYMVPAAFVLLDRLPTTDNGKLDRSRLPTDLAAGPAAPDSPSPGRDGGPGARQRAPEGHAEKAVAGVWRSVLDRDPIHADDDFFAVGGDSIHSLRVVARLRTAGYDVRLQDVFAHPTLHELARVVRRAATAHDDPITPSPFSLISPNDLARLRTRGRRSK